MSSPSSLLPPRLDPWPENHTFALPSPACRPSLLVEPEFDHIPDGIAGLRRHFSEKDVVAVVSKEPTLMLERIDTVLRELER